MPKLITDLPRFTFARASAAYGRKKDGSLQAFTSGQPRQTDAGLWIGGVVSNLLTRSEELDNADWTRAVTVTPNVAVAPDGLLIADKLTPADPSHAYLYQSSGSVSGVHNFSVYAKAAGWDHIQLDDASGGGKLRVRFDLTNGVVVSTTLGANAAIASAGGGWWRCSCDTLSMTVGLLATIIVTDGSGAPVGDGVKAIYGWGAQLTAGSGVKTYVPTGGSAASQLADVAGWSRPGPTVGTLYAEVWVDDVSAAPIILNATGGSTPLWFGGGPPRCLATSFGGVDLYTANLPVSGLNRAAVSWNGNRRLLCLNGGAVAADTSAMTGWTSAEFGGASGVETLQGAIRDLRIQSAPLGPQGLQRLTSL